MQDFVFTSHAQDLLSEQKIHEEWLRLTLRNPDQHNLGEDNNLHFSKVIKQNESRILM
jgi:hypothetical protein